MKEALYFYYVFRYGTVSLH